MSPGRVEPVTEEESTKRAGKGNLPALSPEHCGSAALGSSDGQLILKSFTTMVVIQQPFLTWKLTEQQKSLESSRASEQPIHTHKQAHR